MRFWLLKDKSTYTPTKGPRNTLISNILFRIKHLKESVIEQLDHLGI